MSDIEFEFRGVPNRYQDVIQRMAVLYPLRGVCTGDEQVRERTKALLNQWRARIGALVTCGWEPKRGQSQKTILYCRNCRPTFVITDRPTRPCRLVLVCPFCYARWVREVWLSIDGSFPAPDPVPEVQDAESEAGRELRSIMLDGDVADAEPRHSTVFRWHLIERHHTFYRPVLPPGNPNGTTIAEQLSGILQSIENSRRGTVSLVDPAGAFLYTTIEPWDEGREWKIHHRQLYKMSPEQAFPAELSENLDGGVTRYERPSRKVILSAVARVCRYPTELITGDAERTVQLLDIRRRSGFRGHARYRGFRSSSYE